MNKWPKERSEKKATGQRGERPLNECVCMHVRKCPDVSVSACTCVDSAGCKECFGILMPG